jgi:hypothetical protein
MPAEKAFGGNSHRRELLSGGERAGNLQMAAGAEFYCTLPRLVWLTPNPTNNPSTVPHVPRFVPNSSANAVPWRSDVWRPG